MPFCNLWLPCPLTWIAKKGQVKKKGLSTIVQILLLLFPTLAKVASREPREGIPKWQQRVGCSFDTSCVTLNTSYDQEGCQLPVHYLVPGHRRGSLVHTSAFRSLERTPLWVLTRFVPQTTLALEDVPCKNPYCGHEVASYQKVCKEALCCSI